MRVGQAESAVVIGAGIVGLACALRLQQRGLRTTLVDPQASPLPASYGNAGHIAVEQVEPLASWATIRSAPRRWFGVGGALDVRDYRAFLPWMPRFAAAAAPARFEAGRMALRELLAHATPAWQMLANDLGQPDLVRMDGHVVLWESQASAQRRRAAWAGTDIGTAHFHDLSRDQLNEFAGWLHRRPYAGIRFEGTGQVADVSMTLRKLRETFVSAGGQIRCARVRALTIEDGAAVAVLDDSRLHADVMLVAAGVESRELMASIGWNAPLIAERGYHLQWEEHAWPAAMPVVFEDRSMIVTRFQQGLRAASFVEFARLQTTPDARKWTTLHRHVSELGLPVLGDSTSWMGARPTLPDYLPAIGRSRAIPNLFYAFGHQHLGLTLAPITAEIVAVLAEERLPAMSISAFDLKRFKNP